MLSLLVDVDYTTVSSSVVMLVTVRISTALRVTVPPSVCIVVKLYIISIVYRLSLRKRVGGRAGNRSGSPNGFFNRLPMVRIGAVNFR